MILKTLETENYRNLTDNPPPFDCGINVLYGSNAAGKTNTLEAIYLFAAGKSFRTKSDRDFIRHGEQFARAQILYDDGMIKGRSLSVTFMISGQNTHKGMFVEGGGVDRASEFLGNFRAVLFTPDHLELVKGAPEERRRMVDLALCQIKPAFVRSLNEYSKVLAQRNNYLKSLKIKHQNPDYDYIDVLNRLLAEAGGTVTKQRGLYCRSLDRLANEAYGKITTDSEKLSVSYISKVGNADISDEKECASALYSLYKANTQRDVEQGRTTTGPHRDELLICISKNGEDKAFLQSLGSGASESMDKALTNDAALSENAVGSFAARTFGSQGQQRSAVLAIKMAEGEIVKEKCGEYPVFLLDDLFSELDTQRRTRLCSMLEGRQCIITACDKASIPNIDGINVIKVSGGKFGV